jgi:hypothetical protein
LNKEDKTYIIDVARPDPSKRPPDDMDYKDPDAELVFENLLIIAHEGEQGDLR